VTLAAILPLAFVMIAGPQIITSFFLATSRRWVACSVAYVTGAATSVTTIVTVTYVVASNAKSSATDQHAANRALDGIVLALLIVLILRVFLTRKSSQPPKWMAKLQEATPRSAFLLGLVLLGIFPTDILSSISAGLYVARHGEAWWETLPFVAVTLLLLAIPAAMVLLMGRRTHVVLPAIRNWMNEKSWVVSEIVLVFLSGITINSLAHA
jgi:hypothetical protein